MFRKYKYFYYLRQVNLPDRDRTIQSATEIVEYYYFYAIFSSLHSSTVVHNYEIEMQTIWIAVHPPKDIRIYTCEYLRNKNTHTLIDSILTGDIKVSIYLYARGDMTDMIK